MEVAHLARVRTHDLLFFIHLESRRVCLEGITRHPDEAWIEQMARRDGRKLGKPGAQAIRAARSGHEVLRFVSSDAKIGRNQAHPVAGAQSESGALAERWVRPVKQERL